MIFFPQIMTTTTNACCKALYSPTSSTTPLPCWFSSWLLGHFSVVLMPTSPALLLDSVHLVAHVCWCWSVTWSYAEILKYWDATKFFPPLTFTDSLIFVLVMSALPTPTQAKNVLQLHPGNIEAVMALGLFKIIHCSTLCLADTIDSCFSFWDTLSILFHWC